MSEQSESYCWPPICELPLAGAARLGSVVDASHSEIHVLLVDHSQFRDIEIADGLLVDTRGIWSNHGLESTAHGTGHESTGPGRTASQDTMMTNSGPAHRITSR